MVGIRFRPAKISVKTGGAVTFVNDSKLTHTATCRGCSADTGDLQPGLIRTITFTKPGTFPIFCRYHGAQGMVGEVDVSS